MITLALPVLLGAAHLVAAPANAPWSRQVPAEALMEALPDNEPAHLAISLKVPNRAALSQLLNDLQDPGSPSYHRWITPEQFGERFGVPLAQYDRIANWLTSQGFMVTRSPNRIFIEGTGLAQNVRRALGVQLHAVMDRDERPAHSFAGTPRLPEDIAASVLIIDGLDTRLPFHRHLALGGGQPNVFGAGDLRTFYDINPLLGTGAGGAGQSTVVIATQVQNDPPSATDINWYFQNISNATATYTPITLPVTGNDYDQASANEEYELDVEMQSVGAPYASSINVVLSPASEVFSTGYNYVVTNLSTAAVASISLGSCEPNLGGAQVAQATEQLVDEGIAQGIAYFAAAGDDGADDCSGASSTGQCSGGGSASIDFPSDIPEMVAMGGTQISGSPNWDSNGNIVGYQTEAVWNESPAAGGGGQSTLFSKPSYQTGVGPKASDGDRDSPDFSLTASGASPGVAVDNTGSAGSIAVEGGTSVASPLAAGIFATLAGYCKLKLGDIHSTLYSLGTAQFSSGGKAVFHDVTSGNNSDCGVTGFTAGVGYDLASGWGSIDAAALAAAWPNCGTGVVLDAGTTVPVGTACTANTQCNTNGSTIGQCYAQQEPGADGGLQNTGFYGGYCTEPCVALTDGGITTSGCVANSLCYPESGGGQSLCVEDCSGFFPNACDRTDNVYSCQPLTQGQDSSGNPTFSNFICLPGCQVDADCNAPGQYVCNTATSQCVPTCSGDVSSTGANQCMASGSCANPSVACGTPGATVGAPCTQDNDCPVGGACLTAADGFPNGYCTVAFCGANPSAFCGANAECYILDATTNFGECFKTCTQDSDCGTGYGCGAGNAGGSNICLPASSTTAGGSSSGSSGSAGNGGSSSGSSGNSAGNSSGNGSAGNNSGNNGGNNNGGNNNGGNSSGGNNGSGTTGSGNGGFLPPKPKPIANSGGGGCSTAAPSDVVLWMGWLLGLGLKRRRA